LRGDWDCRSGLWTLLEGESLVNDADGLGGTGVRSALVVTGERRPLAQGFSRLTYLILAGVGDWAIDWLVVEWFETAAG